MDIQSLNISNILLREELEGKRGELNTCQKVSPCVFSFFSFLLILNVLYCQEMQYLRDLTEKKLAESREEIEKGKNENQHIT